MTPFSSKLEESWSPIFQVVPVVENNLPVVLPKMDKFTSGQMTESPLGMALEWKNTTCPQ